jgi:uncharacterized protein
MSKELLIIFFRNPELGKVKTRLAATMGDERALAIYYVLTTHTRNITHSLSCDKVIFYSEYVDKEDAWHNNIYLKQLQDGADLGEKMERAFKWAFDKKYEKVCIIGTDCLELNKNVIELGFESLNLNDAVIGPAHDGGYYLLGLKKTYPELFKNKFWSTDKVTEETIADFKSLKISYYLLPTLNDVDTEEDLPSSIKI